MKLTLRRLRLFGTNEEKRKSPGRLSAFGTKRTSLVAPHMSAFGSKADTFRRASGRTIGGHGDYPTFAQKLLESADTTA